MTPSLVAVAHGSRDPRSAATVAELAERVRVLHPDLDVRVAFLDLSEPRLDTVLAGVESAVVVPLLLGHAFHAEVDVPGVVADAVAARPHLDIRIADVLGPGLPSAPSWLLPTHTGAGSDEPTAAEHAESAEPAEAGGSDESAGPTETTTELTTEASMPPRKHGRAGRELQNMRDTLDTARDELGADLDAEEDVEVPQMDLSDIAEHHQVPADQLDPADQKAAEALLQALTQAGEDGLTRANVATHAELDEITCQRLLGRLERLGHVTGDDGVGPQIRWHIVPTTSPNGHHATSNGDTTGREA